ncbi:MAG: phosphoglycerate dehydrogenase [Flavipsychrobacter sp.]
MNTDIAKQKVLLLEGIHANAKNAFIEAGYTDIEEITTSLSKQELVDKIKSVNIIGIRSNTHLTKEVLDAAKNLSSIGCFCIGTNQVDTNHAGYLGIPVFNAPFSNTRSVAELTIATIIHLMRGIPEKNIAAHKGIWKKSAKDSFEVRKKVLGIVGYGNIGSQLSVIASALGMHVYYYDVDNKLQHGNATQVESLEQLLSMSDVVSLHVPATGATENLIGEKEFKKMKNGSFLVNYSRGNVIDIDALVNNLESGKILGAAIDVFPVEPKSIKETFTSPLQQFDNVLLTPHIGGSTQEAQENIGLEVAEKLIKYNNIGATSFAVNFPETTVIHNDNAQRITHIHYNEPGILRKIIKIVADRDLNILAQSLQTNATIGYVILDIEPTDKIEEILAELEQIPGTIKARIIKP